MHRVIGVHINVDCVKSFRLACNKKCASEHVKLQVGQFISLLIIITDLGYFFTFHPSDVLKLCACYEGHVYDALTTEFELLSFAILFPIKDYTCTIMPMVQTCRSKTNGYQKFGIFRFKFDFIYCSVIDLM